MIREFTEEEDWRDVNGYVGIYQVSNLGRIKSLARLKSNGKNSWPVKERMLTPIIHTQGYIEVALCNGKLKRFYVHRLVATAFIPNPENKPQVNHISGVKSDNRVVNLEWATNKENGKHASANGLYYFGEENRSSKLTTTQASEIFSAPGKQREIAEKYNIAKSVVGAIKKKKIWKQIHQS